ncbi:YfcL family protein [Serratia microhaemolytica]|uniref:YfcL family protein n=1 Tax=Serratia microhaemolytica TaxID=2675110 RepID=UPI000FDE88C9|nr:YfcL family protein [Serratia microhaemolytica]
MIADFEARVLTLIDEMVEHGSDDELFAGGYLRGHLTLAVAQAQEKGDTTLTQLDMRVRHSLVKAIKAGELAPADQVLVLGLWQRLYQTALLELEE